jgi:hypothetical protein
MIDVPNLCNHTMKVNAFHQHPGEDGNVEKVKEDGNHLTGEFLFHQVILEFEGNQEEDVCHEEAKNDVTVNVVTVGTSSNDNGKYEEGDK